MKRELSPRERQVYELTREGLSAAEISARLELARSTVLTYRQRAADKLGLSRALRLIEGRRSALRL